MLTDMERKQEQALKVLRQQVLETSLDMEREEAAEFFGELADWAYAQQEAMLIDEPEMQNYDRTNPIKIQRHGRKQQADR